MMVKKRTSFGLGSTHRSRIAADREARQMRAKGFTVRTVKDSNKRISGYINLIKHRRKR